MADPELTEEERQTLSSIAVSNDVLFEGALDRLRELGFVERHDGRWQITEAGRDYRRAHDMDEVRRPRL